MIARCDVWSFFSRRLAPIRIFLASSIRIGLLFLPFSIWAADWLQYAGPNGDGSTAETIRTNWTAQAPALLWKKTIGAGFSSIVVRGQQLFTQEKRNPGSGDREYVVARNAETGDELWKVDVGSAVYTDLSGYDKRMDGPRSTPTIDGDFVYVFNSYLKLFCLRAATGELVWSHDFTKQNAATVIQWQNAASPLIVGNLVIVHGNAGGTEATKRIFAFNKLDGSIVWQTEKTTMTHATPIYTSIYNVPQVVFLTQTALVSLSPENGHQLWRKDGLSFSTTSTAATPVIADNYVHASSAYGAGTWVLRISTNADGSFTATQTSQQRGTSYQCHWASGINYNGFVYAIPSPNSGQGRLACFDPKGGTNRWTQSNVGSGNLSFGSVIRAGGVLIVVTEAGEIVLVDPNPTQYTELARLKALQLYCWNRPTLANGRLYVRSTSASPQLAVYDVAPPKLPVPDLSLSAALADPSTLKLILSAADGSALEEALANQIDLLSADSLTTPAAQWTSLQPTFTPDNGRLVTTLPAFLQNAAKFIRAQAKP